MSESATGRIKIEGDASEFKKMVEEILKGNKKIEEDLKDMGGTIGESFVTVANNALGLFEKLKSYVVGVYDHIKNAAISAAEVQKRDIALTMLKRYNREYYDITKNIEKYTNGLMKSEDAIFLINKAVHRNIGLTKDQLEEVLKMSSKVAVSIGAEIEEVFDKISESVGKFETAPLEELGIIIDLEAAVKKYAAAQGKTADEIDNLTKKEIVLAETRKRIKDGLTGTISDKEFDIKMELNKTLSILDKSFRESGEQYNKFWAKQVKTINDFAMQEANIIKIRYAKEREILKGHLKGQYNSWGEYQESQTKRTEIWTDGQVRIMTTYSQEYYQSLAKIQNAVDDFKKSMESKAAFNNFYVGLQELKYQIKPITDQLVKLKESIWFLKSESVELTPTVDKDKINKLRETEISQILSYYDKINEQEFKTYEDKEAWEKRKLELQKKINKMGLTDLKSFKKDYDKILFGLDKTKKEGEAFDKQLEDEAAMYQKKLEQHKAYIESKMLLDDELTQHSLQQLQARDKVNISDANSVQELVGIYNKEIANFKEYAKIKKLDQEDLSGGLANITNRYIKKKQEIEEKDFEFEKQLKEQAKSFAINTATSLYNSLLADEEDAVQKAIANSMLQAGSSIYAAGLENIWIGFGKTLSVATLPAGLKQMAGGALQVGAGVGLGYVGKQLMPPGADTTSDSAKLENQMAQQDKKLSDESKIYMFPSEQKWLEEINRANKKIKR